MKTLQNNTKNESKNAAAMVASFNPEYVRHIILYADNSREIYDAREWLAGCVAKVIRKGIEPDRARLVKSVHVARIIKQAADIARADEWCKVSAADEAQAREELATAIIERAGEIAEEMDEKGKK